MKKGSITWNHELTDDKAQTGEVRLEQVLAPFIKKKLVKATNTDDGLILWFEGGPGLLLYNYMGHTCIAQTDMLN